MRKERKNIMDKNAAIKVIVLESNWLHVSKLRNLMTK